MSVHVNKARKQYFICYKTTDEAGKQKTISVYNRDWTLAKGKKYVKSIEQAVVEDDIRKRKLRLRKGDTCILRDLLDDVEADWSLRFKRQTSYHKTHIAEKYIFGMFPVEKTITEVFTIANVEEFRKKVADTGLSQDWMNKIFGVLREVLSFSSDRDYLPYETSMKLSNILKPIVGRKEMAPKLMFWTNDEWDRFIASFDDDDRFKVLFELTYCAGLRFGEVLALKWEDFLPESKTISVNKSSDNSGIISSTKNTSSNATVTIPETMIERLSKFRCDYAANDGDFIFFANHRTSRTTVRRVMKEHIDKSGVPFIKFHGLRHSCASRMIHAGISPLIVSKHLRHSSVKETLDTYSHLFPNDTVGVIDKVF